MENLAKKYLYSKDRTFRLWRQKNAGNESDLILQLAFQQKWDFTVDFAVYVYCMLKDDEVMKTRLVVSACFVSEGHDMAVFFSVRSGSTLRPNQKNGGEEIFTTFINCPFLQLLWLRNKSCWARYFWSFIRYFMTPGKNNLLSFGSKVHITNVRRIFSRNRKVKIGHEKE